MRYYYLLRNGCLWQQLCSEPCILGKFPWSSGLFQVYRKIFMVLSKTTPTPSLVLSPSPFHFPFPLVKKSCLSRTSLSLAGKSRWKTEVLSSIIGPVRHHQGNNGAHWLPSTSLTCCSASAGGWMKTGLCIYKELTSESWPVCWKAVFSPETIQGASLSDIHQYTD